MVGPIAFDPTGPCVLLLAHDGKGAYLFHAEILRKAGTKWAEEDVIKSLPRHKHVANDNERPLEVQTTAGNWLLAPFKRWAYHGDLGSPGCRSLTHTLELIEENREDIGVDAFEDVLVDQAIKILTSNRDLSEDDFRREVLIPFRRWPAGFQSFVFDALLADDADEYWQEHEMFVLETEEALEDLDRRLLIEFGRKALRRSVKGHKIRKADVCKYHGHARGHDCYKMPGAIDNTKSEPEQQPELRSEEPPRKRRKTVKSEDEDEVEDEGASVQEIGYRKRDDHEEKDEEEDSEVGVKGELQSDDETDSV